MCTIMVDSASVVVVRLTSLHIAIYHTCHLGWPCCSILGHLGDQGACADAPRVHCAAGGLPTSHRGAVLDPWVLIKEERKRTNTFNSDLAGWRDENRRIPQFSYSK